MSRRPALGSTGWKRRFSASMNTQPEVRSLPKKTASVIFFTGAGGTSTALSGTASRLGVKPAPSVDADPGNGRIPDLSLRSRTDAIQPPPILRQSRYSSPRPRGLQHLGGNAKTRGPQESVLPCQIRPYEKTRADECDCCCWQVFPRRSAGRQAPHGHVIVLQHPGAMQPKWNRCSEPSFDWVRQRRRSSAALPQEATPNSAATCRRQQCQALR